MQIFLRNGAVTEQPEKVILQYYKEMGSGVRAYDDSFIPGYEIHLQKVASSRS